jgi:hypothetical protein
MFDPHLMLVFLHIVGFVLWLGADLGVFYAARYVADGTLPLDERYRFLSLLMTLDMFPRSMLIIMLPLGLQLAVNLQMLRIDSGAMLFVWLGAAAWFSLMWAGHHKPQLQALKQLDLGVRWLVLAGLVGVGFAALFGFGVEAERWIAVKMLAFAAVIALGLLLRGCVAQWMQGFALQASDKPRGDALIAAGRATGARFALLLWGFLLFMAYLGVMKPYLG